MLPHDEAYLMHHGVLGMHWGIRKQYIRRGRKRGASLPPKSQGSSREQAYQKKHSEVAKSLGLNAKALQDKYGDSNGFSEFIKAHKAQIIAGTITIATLAYLYYSGKQAFANPEVRNALAIFGNELRRAQAYKYQVDGLKINWEKGVELPIGSIVKRVSTVVEKDIRPGGFYGAFLDSDVNAYKGILPGFWQVWGKGSIKEGGFVNHYRALQAIKAPSGSESLAIFKELAFKDLENSKRSSEIPLFLAANGLYGSRLEKMTEDEWHTAFINHALSWTATDFEPTKMYFEAVKAKGYNALIDFNDAGRLAKTPLRVIDASIFEISGHEKLTFDEIASEIWKFKPELVHVYLPEGRAMLVHDLELRHHGVLGMHWGIRKKEVPVYTTGTRRGVPYSKPKMQYRRGKPKQVMRTQTHLDVRRDPHRKPKRQHRDAMGYFEKVVDTMIIGMGGALTIRFLSPTVDHYGKKFATYVTSEVGKRALKKTLGI